MTSEDPWKRWWHLADCGRGFVKLPVPTGEDRSEWDARFDGVEVDELDPDELQRDWTATWLAELAGRLGFIPRDRFGETADINQLDDDLLQWWVYVRPFVPSSDEVRVAHGSWFRALVAAGVLDADMRRGRFGTHVLAEDGCFCTSLAEKLIDDLMFELGVEHQKEPHYPGSNMRADWQVGGTLVEYFGLQGIASYDEKTILKTQMAADAGIPLLALTAEDLKDRRALKKTLRALKKA